MILMMMLIMILDDAHHDHNQTSEHVLQSDMFMKRTHHLSGMMLFAIASTKRASNNSTGLSAPKRGCMPIMKAST
jgi:hypothetical protein